MSEHIYIYVSYVYVQLSFVFFARGKLKKKQKTNLRETQNVKKKALRG